MSTELTKEAEERLLDQQVAEAFKRMEEGISKEASQAQTNMIRRRIYEEGFQRQILKYRPITRDKLTKLPNVELPVYVEDMEPLAPRAKAIPFNDSQETQFYRSEQFVTTFCQITTPEFTKNRFELMTQTINLREVVTENALREVHTAEDSRFTATLDRITGNVGGSDGEPYDTAQPHDQFVLMNGSLDRKNWVDSMNALETRFLHNGIALMNIKTAREFQKLNRTELGGDKAQDMFLRGLKSLGRLEVEIPIIATIKHDLIPNGYVYQFAPENYFGRAYMLEDLKMRVERKKDIIRFCAYETIGVSIANTNAAQLTAYSALTGASYPE